MSRKRTHRTVRDPMSWVIKRLPIADDQTRDLGNAYRIALQTLLDGRGTEQTWSTVACALNIALLLSEKGINAEAEPIITLAQEAMLQVRAQANASGEWRINLAFHKKQAILAAINAHDEQCAVATKQQIQDALREVHRRVEAGEVFREVV